MKVADLLVGRFIVLERNGQCVAVEVVSVNTKERKIKCRPLEEGKVFTGRYDATQIGDCDVFESDWDAVRDAKRRNK